MLDQAAFGDRLPAAGCRDRRADQAAARVGDNFASP